MCTPKATRRPWQPFAQSSTRKECTAVHFLHPLHVILWNSSEEHLSFPTQMHVNGRWTTSHKGLLYSTCFIRLFTHISYEHFFSVSASCLRFTRCKWPALLPWATRRNTTSLMVMRHKSPPHTSTDIMYKYMCVIIHLLAVNKNACRSVATPDCHLVLGLEK